MECPVQCGRNAHAAPGFFFGRNCRYSIRNGCAARCRRQRSMGIGEFPQQAENRFRVTKALLAEEWVLKKSFKIWKNFRLILFVSWSRI